MRFVHVTRLICAGLLLFSAAAVCQAQTAGYWKYLRTDQGVYNGYPSSALHDSAAGGEGSLTLTDSTADGTGVFSVTLSWYTPPMILIPGALADWRVSGKVGKNSGSIHPTGDWISLSSTWCGEVKADPADGNCGHPIDGPGGVKFYQTPGAGNDAPGVTRAASNLDPAGHSDGDGNVVPPRATPGSTPSGFLTWQVQASVSYGRAWIFHYNYQWVAGSPGNCAGTCTLGSAGQTIGASGGPGSVSIAATSTWDVTTPDNWIHVALPSTGSGNSTVTFTVDPNTSTIPRAGILIIGGKPYSILQEGTGNQSSQGGLELHRPKLVVTDTSGNSFTLQPAPGPNDATDDGSATAGKDAGVFGQSSGNWGDHKFGPDSTAFVMTSTCNNSTGYAYLQFSPASLPTQNIASAKVQVYMTSHTVGNLSPVGADPVFAARRVSGAWDESKITWNTGQPTFDSAILDSQTLTGAGNNKSDVTAWLSFDVTSLYKGWAGGSTPNYGIRLSHENGQCLNGWQGILTTSDDVPAAQTGACAYGLSLTSAAATAAGGSGSFTITASSSTCAWSAGPDASWLRIGSPASGAGSSTVSYAVDANPGASRSGTLTLTGGGQTMKFTVVQAGSGNSVATGQCSGTCTLAAPSQVIGVNGGPGSVAITATSTWNVVVIDSWIQVTSSTSGASNGIVTFTVPANTQGPRSGVILIGNQTYTIYQNGTPTGTTAGCSYLIQSNTVQTAPAAGTSNGFIQIITAQGCAWTATKTAAWLTIKSGSTGTGNGAVSYSVAANATGIPRSAPIVIAGQTVAVNQESGTVPRSPAVSAGGVVNTANYAPGGPPNGALAQGSFFSIYGSDLGPDPFVKADTYPLPATLGGVAVQITQGANKYDAYLVFVSKGQINAILPSAVPVGTAQVVVTYNGVTGAPATITVVKTSVGIFYQQIDNQNFGIAQNINSATDYPLNLPGTPAKPGQYVILWGTGIGPITGADNIAPPAGDMDGVPVSITVGGIAAQRVYAGRQPQTAAVDNIYFTVPAGVPYGCYVPVAIAAGGVTANTTVIAITSDGSPCR
jgi:uncharacterized protein (TIGR03437 family)